MYLFLKTAFIFLLLYLNLFAIEYGLYKSKNLDVFLEIIEDNSYDIWIEDKENILEIQYGKYKIYDKTIIFNPIKSDMGNLESLRGKIIDNCSIKIDDEIFVLQNCIKTVKKKDMPNQKWYISKKNGIELFIPKKSNIKYEKSKILIKYKDGEAAIVDFRPKYINNLIKSCNPKYKFIKKNSTFFICKNRKSKKYLNIFENKKNKRGYLIYLKADDINTIKTLSISLSSIKYLNKKSIYKANFIDYRPKDRSFVIKIPKGWNAEGGTADFGANGYVRIVKVTSPNKKIGFIGFYYPFYKFAQTYMGSNGDYPMTPKDYIENRLFHELYQNYNIFFENLNIKKIEIDQDLSRKFNEEFKKLAFDLGINLDKSYTAFNAYATYKNDSYKMNIFGFISYLKQPFNIGVTYSWGPEPIFICFYHKNEDSKYNKIFYEMAYSWQVDQNWLIRHQKRAKAESQKIISHYRKMREIIHKNYQERIENSLKEWEKEENEKMEEFWDTFYSLGGEERYNDPDTGEEVDVPIGANRYLYDNVTSTWVGIKDFDKIDEDKIVEYLKDRGFKELKPHIH